jgi:hypothetical protein
MYRSCAKKDGFLLQFSGILRGKRKNKTGEFLLAQRTSPSRLSRSWLAERLRVFYHKIASKSPSRPTPTYKQKELDFAYLRCTRTSICAVFNYALVLFRTQEEQAMNKTERDALNKILFALFLESPKRKALFGQQTSEKTGVKPTQPQKIRTYQLGDIAHGSN